MTLLELCEPLFQYACRINQRATLGDHPDPVQVEADVEGILTSMRNKASKTAGLIEQYKRVELPLIFFIDNIIFESQLSFSKDWPRLAYKRNEMAGDEKFFVLLDEELRTARRRRRWPNGWRSTTRVWVSGSRGGTRASRTCCGGTCGSSSRGCGRWSTPSASG